MQISHSSLKKQRLYTTISHITPGTSTPGNTLLRCSYICMYWTVFFSCIYHAVISEKLIAQLGSICHTKTGDGKANRCCLVWPGVARGKKT